jgi:hypothetical protein
MRQGTEKLSSSPRVSGLSPPLSSCCREVQVVEAIPKWGSASLTLPGVPATMDLDMTQKKCADSAAGWGLLAGDEVRGLTVPPSCTPQKRPFLVT